MTKRSLGLVALTTGSLIFLSACSGESGATTETDQHLTVALAVEPVSLDPCDTQDAANAVVLRGNVTESLTRIDPETGEVVPLLAESWEQEDEHTWTFNLREGVAFHDGEPFNAQAAAASINRVVDPDLNCQTLDQFPYPVEAVAVDEYTLEISSESPDSILPLRVSYADIGSPSTPQDEKTTAPVGTGPFSFAAREQGQSVTVERFDDYWGEAPEASGATYVYRAEPAVRAGMAETGEASIAVPVSVQHATEDDRTREYSDNRVFFLRTPTEAPPFDDIRVRQALHHAIDKETIVGTLMARSGMPTDQMLAPTVNAYLPDYQGPQYDPERAQDLLAEAAADGVPVETAFDLVTRPDIFPGGDEVIQAIQQNLQEAGFTADILSVDTDAWLEVLRRPHPAEEKPSVIAISHDNISGDASFSYPKYIDGEGPNSTIDNEEINALLAEAELAVGEERRELYQQVSHVLYEDVAAMVPVALQTNLLMLAEGIEYEPNGLTGVELRLSDVHFTQ